MDRSLAVEVLDILSSHHVPMEYMLFPKKFQKNITTSLESYLEADLIFVFKEMIHKELIGCDIFDFLNWPEKKVNKFDFSNHQCFFLTQKGGQMWEGIFEPKWENFVEILIDDFEFMEMDSLINIQIMTPNRIFMNEILNPFKEINIKINLTSSIGWSPVYWKTIENSLCYSVDQNLPFEYGDAISEAYGIASELARQCCPKSNNF